MAFKDPIARPYPRLPGDYDTRLHFLHRAIEDNQDTIRFLDTKAAFCVTLFSGMVAVSLQHTLTNAFIRHVVFPAFIAVVACGLLTSLRVIFPRSRPHGSGGAPASPKFFIGHDRDHRWIRHTLFNPKGNILSETPASYAESMRNASDLDQLNSLSETAVAIAFIRQLKADRLHSAMYCLAVAILMFAILAIAEV